MPIKYTINNDGTFIHALVTGSPTDKDLLDYGDALENDSRIRKPGFVELFDASRIDDTDVSIDALHLLAEKLRANPDKLAAVKLAIVIRPSLLSQKAAYYKKLVSDIENTIVFYDVSTAKTWLGVSEKE
ncbi:MAG: hypothetical protein P9M03_10350 [Candidatus Theseobacter exili]|nr:hypothetical protein [Candidatus Theseobacter exili]